MSRTKRIGIVALVALATVTVCTTAAVKLDVFKYLYAQYVFSNDGGPSGWEMTHDGDLCSDAPDGVEIVYDVRPETSKHPGPYLKRTSDADSNGENSEP